MDNSKYYFVKRKGDKAYPMVGLQNMSRFQAGLDDILEVIIRPPIPRNPVMGDFLSGGSEYIFTKRVTEVMKAMNMEGVEFLPAEIEDNKGNIYDNYECIIVDNNTYPLLDLEKSVYDTQEFSGGKKIVYTAEKVVIDREKLNKIPLNKRLGMCLDEAPGYNLFHQTVVDAVMALEPTGMYFQDIEDYEIL